MLVGFLIDYRKISWFYLHNSTGLVSQISVPTACLTAKLTSLYSSTSFPSIASILHLFYFFPDPNFIGMPITKRNQKVAEWVIALQYGRSSTFGINLVMSILHQSHFSYACIRFTAPSPSHFSVMSFLR